MAFETGTASTYLDLVNKVNTFLSSNGYALTSGIITKSGTNIHVEFSNPITSEFKLEMGKGSSAGNLLDTHDDAVTLTGSADQDVGMCTQYYNGETMVFPINYFFQLYSTPVNEFRCVIEYNNGLYQNCGFGEIVKATNFFGGIYIDGSVARRSTGGGIYNGSDMSNLTWEYASLLGGSVRRVNLSPLPFGEGGGPQADYPSATQIWADLMGFDWWITGYRNFTNGIYAGTRYANASYLNHMLYSTKLTHLLGEYSQQAYNGNAALVPISLFGRPPSGNRIKIGDIENIRLINIKNIAPGEVIDDGTDQWKCYPAFKKEATTENGTGDHSGQIGFAVRYDGP